MENLFDVIGNRMFSVFASKDRRANYELLLFIYDTFTQDECMQVIEKGEIVDKFAEYIKQHSFSELDDEEGVDILAKSAKEKANSITLEVNVNNIPAIKLYEKYNFEKVGLRKRYYYGTDDAIIMTLHI